MIRTMFGRSAADTPTVDNAKSKERMRFTAVMIPQTGDAVNDKRFLFPIPLLRVEDGD